MTKLKKIIEEYREIIIGNGKHVTWKDFKDTPNISDDDFIDELEWRLIENDKDELTIFVPVLTVYSKREETDEEYEKRLASEQNSENIINKINYQEYLRLKKIYEPDN